jgi:thiosulfate reductase cytochrome b subunit
VWADPLGYARAVAAIPRRAFKQATFMRPELMRPEHPSPGWLAAVGAWQRAYRKVLYASFPLFVVLLGLACWNGLGWPAAVAPFRAFVGPFVVALLVTVALGSLSTYDVGRLALPFHPFYCIEWGLVAGWAAARVRARAH